MENRKEASGWMSVPAFGDWDMKNGAVPDYSMDFTKIREMRKQNKKELSRASLGGDDDLMSHQKDHQAPPPAATAAGDGDDADHRHPLHAHGDHSPTGRKKFLSYFQCCIRA